MNKDRSQNRPPDRYQRGRGRRGVAVIELAVCLPIIVLLVLSTIEACSMIFLKQSLSIAAYEGARTAIIPSATADDVQKTCEQILADRHVAGVRVRVKPKDIGSLQPGDFVDVIVSAPCNANSVVRNTFYRGRRLSAKASMMIEF